MKVQTQNEKGEWVQALEEPYYPSWFEKFWCWIGFHKFRVSNRFRNTLECYKCGFREVNS